MNCCYRMANGQTMASYCDQNGYNKKNIYRIADKYGYTPEQAIEHFLRTKKDTTKKYFYNGQTLYAYCASKPNGRKIYSNLYFILKRKNCTPEQAIAYYNNIQKGKGNDTI